MELDVFTCNISGVEPMQLPITDNQVSVAGTGATYGIAIALSEVKQFFSVKPALNANNTFIVNANYCKIPTNYSCIAENGGVYNPPANALVNVDPVAWNGTVGSDIVIGDDYQEKLYNDVLHLQNHEIFGFPFYTYERESDGCNPLVSALLLPLANLITVTQPSSLALGLNSSFLQAALDAELIGTKAWSL